MLHTAEVTVCSEINTKQINTRGDGRAVFVVGPVITGPTTNTARLSPRYKGKTRGCHSSH
jgi:hypothetical protein